MHRLKYANTPAWSLTGFQLKYLGQTCNTCHGSSVFTDKGFYTALSITENTVILMPKKVVKIREEPQGQLSKEYIKKTVVLVNSLHTLTDTYTHTPYVCINALYSL